MHFIQLLSFFCLTGVASGVAAQGGTQNQESEQWFLESEEVKIIKH